MRKLSTLIFLLVFLAGWAPTASAHEIPSPTPAAEPAPEQAATQDQPPAAEEAPGPSQWFANTNLLMGEQHMLEAQWKEINAQRLDVIEFSLDIARVEWPVSVYVAMESATRPNSRYKTGYDYSITTLMLGPRWFITKTGPIRPYISGGWVSVSANRSSGVNSDFNEVDSAKGVFANAGVIFKLGRYFHLGLEGSMVAAGGLEGKNNSDHLKGAVVIGVGSQ